MRSDKKILQPTRVLVTRPEHQADGFCQLLQDAGFEPLRCPTVEISNVQNKVLAAEQLMAISDADIVIFTSANAVRYAEKITSLKDTIAENAKVLAIGPATAATLSQCGLEAQLPEQNFSSAGLLAMKTLHNVIGKTVIVIRGCGGLATLPDALHSAGANLGIAEVYQRRIPASDSILRRLFHSELPQIISTTSNETLSNLVTLTPVEERPRLWQLPVIVNSKRGEQLAYSLGFSDDILRASPVSDYGQINTLKAWITQRLTQR